MQTFLALLAGYFLLSALNMFYLPLITFLVFGADPSQAAARGFPGLILTVILCCDLIAGFIAGYVAARVAGFQPIRHGYYLTIVVFVINLIMLISSGPDGPWWYASARQVGLLLIIPFGARFSPPGK